MTTLTLPKVNTIEVGDCAEIMAQWPDKCFDLCLTDFPFGVGTDYGVFVDSREILLSLIDRAMPQILRVSKRAMIACGVQNISLYPQPDWIMSWIFPETDNKMPWGYSAWQPILCYGESNWKGSDVVVQHAPKVKEVADHPSPKSLTMWTRILQRGILKPGEWILDPLMGSGTTAIAALHSGCTYSGIELNPNYVEIAKRRIAHD